MGYVWLLAAVWMGLSVLAATLSIRTGISVALTEIFIGAIAANTIGLAAAPWVDYLAGLGAIILAFLCGAEVQLDAVRDRAWANVSIGAGAFLLAVSCRLSVLLMLLSAGQLLNLCLPR